MTDSPEYDTPMIPDTQGRHDVRRLADMPNSTNFLFHGTGSVFADGKSKGSWDLGERGGSMPKAITLHGLRARLFASLVGVLFVAATASAQQKPKLRPLRIALPAHSVSATAVYVAQRLGIFERYGFDAQILVLEPRAALAAMLTGDLDFYAAVGTVGRAALTGVPVRVVLVALNRSDLVLLASKDITTVEQLRGKALGGYTAQASVNVILTELFAA